MIGGGRMTYSPYDIVGNDVLVDADSSSSRIVPMDGGGNARGSFNGGEGSGVEGGEGAVLPFRFVSFG